MVRQLLVRGLVVGAVAGVLAFVVAYVLGEPQIQRAIDFESASGPVLVSRGVQRSIGLLTGSVVSAPRSEGSSRSSSPGRTGASGRSARGSWPRCSAPARS